MPRILVAGPWVGEFGYELFRWQGFIRKQAYDEEFDEVIIASRSGHEVLYEDFCDRYVAYDADLAPCEGPFNGTARVEMELAVRTFRGIPYTTIIPAMKIVKEPQLFVPYGKAGSGGFDILIHARYIQVPAEEQMLPGRKAMKESRNWSIQRWDELMPMILAKGYTVASIGSPTAALHVPGSDDLRGIALAQLADLMRSALLVVGPSSGASHFATLCQCPQAVWGSPHLERRYKVDWNPLNTPVAFLPVNDTWDPSAEQVFKLMQALC